MRLQAASDSRREFIRSNSHALNASKAPDKM